MDRLLYDALNSSVLYTDKLPEAITIASKDIDLEHIYDGGPHISSTLIIEEDFSIQVNSIWHAQSFNSFGWSPVRLNYYHMNFAIYIADIKVAEYEYELDLCNNEKLYRPWKCKNKTISHQLPPDHLQYLNVWICATIMNFKMEKEEAMERAKILAIEKYNMEEDKLRRL